MLEEQFLSHSCCYAAHNILGFKYLISAASRFATKMTHAVHEIA